MDMTISFFNLFEKQNHSLACSLKYTDTAKIEPPRGKTNVVSDQVQHEPTCTVTEKSLNREISNLSRRGTVLSQ